MSSESAKEMDGSDREKPCCHGFHRPKFGFANTVA